MKSVIKSSYLGPGQCGSVGWSIVPYTKSLRVWFPVRAHPRLWVLSPVGGHARGSRSMFLCLSLCLSPSLCLSLSLSSSLRSMKVSPWWKIKKQKFLPWLYQSGNHRKSSLQIQKLPSFEERYNHLSSNPELLLELISPVSSCSWR